MRSGFFNSEITGWDAEGLPQFDRAESADFFAEFFHTFFKNGVFTDPADSLMVYENTNQDMTVLVHPGKTIIEGYFGWEPDTRTIQFEASETLDRIDRVVLRLNLADKKIDLAVRKGIAATVPVAPELVRPQPGQSGDIYELGIANVFIPKNSTSITQSRITDTRLNAEDCGVSIFAYDNPDLTAVFTQYQAALNQYMSVVAAALDETLYGQLVSLINVIEAKVNSPITTITLLASGWSADNIYTITDSDITATSNQEFLPLALSRPPTQAELENNEALQSAGLSDAGQEVGKQYIYAADKPTKNLQMRMVKRGVK